MIPLATILSLLGSPAGQAVAKLGAQELGYGFGDLHQRIQIDLYNDWSRAILYRGQVIAYVRTINRPHMKVPCKWIIFRPR